MVKRAQQQENPQGASPDTQLRIAFRIIRNPKYLEFPSQSKSINQYLWVSLFSIPFCLSLHLLILRDYDFTSRYIAHVYIEM